MGSENGERSADPDEYPLRQVSIPKAFWMGVLPTTELLAVETKLREILAL